MSNFSDPLALKEYYTQFNGDFDNRAEISMYNDEMYNYAMIKGIPIEYYTINVDDYKDGIDIVYGENSKPKWDRKYTMVGILEDFTQEVRSFGAIPLQMTDDLTMFIHRNMFDEIIGIRTNKQTNKSSNRRGAYGPIPNDLIKTPHNGLIYEVVEGGLHFLPSEAQTFGHKFWYKITCKSREVSDATMGEGEQYGATPDSKLVDKYKGNPQYLLDSPTEEELYASNGTIDPIVVTTQPPTAGCSTVEYVTTGTLPGPTQVPPNDLIDQSGSTSEKYIVPGLKENSLFRDNENINSEANTTVNPQTDHEVSPTSQDGIKYAPGRVLPHKRKELFKDWDN